MADVRFWLLLLLFRERVSVFNLTVFARLSIRNKKHTTRTTEAIRSDASYGAHGTQVRGWGGWGGEGTRAHFLLGHRTQPQQAHPFVTSSKRKHIIGLALVRNLPTHSKLDRTFPSKNDYQVPHIHTHFVTDSDIASITHLVPFYFPYCAYVLFSRQRLT